jgi:transcription elongation factor GreB
VTDLITIAGRDKLQEEYDFLWTKDRPGVLKEVMNAALDGDRSDNAPYQFAKRRLREIDCRLRYLGARLKVLKIGHALANPRFVTFACWVSYEDDQGNNYCWQIVGPDEFDVSKGRISIDSPVGQALFGKKVDDEVFIKRPAGNLNVTITAISSKKPSDND